jgi:hypothetical protein
MDASSMKKDNCPPWAEEAIAQLQQMEIYLGNIPSHPLWQSQHLDAISKRSFERNEQVFNEEKTELLFKKIVQGLTQDGFAVAQIVEFINARISYKGAPPYCNTAEVATVVKS